MRLSFRSLAVLFLIICMPISLWAAAQSNNTPTSNPWSAYMIPAAPALDAKGYVLMDVDSGQVIASKNPHEKMPPASLTKLMTLYLVFTQLANGTIHLNDKVLISKKAWQTGGSRMFVKVGSEVPVEDLIQGVIVQSGNDATMALAEYVGGNETTFVQMMDQAAKNLGMKDSHFSDPTGLPMPDHLTTPYDLAILARTIIEKFPQYYHFFGEKWFKWNNIRQPNRNRLLWRGIGVDGMKTGHTESAGYCLISSAKQSDTRLLSVVMGTPTDMARANESQALLNYGFRFFQTAQIYKANETITQQRVWKGEQNKISLGVLNDYSVVIPRSAYKDMKVTLTINPSITAPISKGQALGSINVYVKDKQIASTPLVALSDDDAGSWWTRFWDAIAHWFHNLFHKSKTTEVVVGQQNK